MLIDDKNPRTLALLATLTMVLAFADGLTGMVYVRLVDANGEIVTSDILGHAYEEDGNTLIYFANQFGDFKIFAGKAADALLALDTPAVRARAEHLAYYAADDFRARAEYAAR